MKKAVLLIIGLIAILAPVLKAQPNEEVRKQVEQLRKNVYARVLILSDEEAKAFWPVFDQMQNELESIQQEERKIRRSIHDNYSSLTDADIEKATLRLFELEEKAVATKRKYFYEFKKVLPMKKIALIPKAEREFKKELLQKYKGQRPGGPPED